MVDPSQFEKSFEFLAREFGLVLQTVRRHPEYVSRGMTGADVHFREVTLVTVRGDERTILSLECQY